MNTQQTPRKFQVGDTVQVKAGYYEFQIGDDAFTCTGLYADITTKVTGCYIDEIHGGTPYVTVDLCGAAFYEDALITTSTEPEKCEVCEKTDGPFIRVEVSDDGEKYQWLLACSDECLHQIILRWKQTGEIIRP